MKVELWSVLVKYIMYIQKMEGTDYVISRQAKGIAPAEFTRKEWKFLKEVCTYIDEVEGCDIFYMEDLFIK